MFFKQIFKKEKIENKRIITFLGYRYEYDRNDFRRSKIAFSSKIKNAKLGGANVISKGVIIKADKKSHVSIGKGTDIGEKTQVIAHNGAEIKIGENCRIGHNNKIVAVGDIEIGNNVLMASNISFYTGNHGYEDVETPIMYQPSVCKKITIGDESWIAGNVMLLCGITIGKHCVIGGGSIVTKDIPDYCVAAGNPCKLIKRYNFETKTWERV